MWLKTRKETALDRGEKERIGHAEVVRRIEISVEREVCSLTVHGQLVSDDQQSCPLCGQSLTAGKSEASGSLNELPRSISNDEGKTK